MYCYNTHLVGGEGGGEGGDGGGGECGGGSRSGGGDCGGGVWIGGGCGVVVDVVSSYQSMHMSFGVICVSLCYNTHLVVVG